jgi:hypothetical protein
MKLIYYAAWAFNNWKLSSILMGLVITGFYAICSLLVGLWNLSLFWKAFAPIIIASSISVSIYLTYYLKVLFMYFASHKRCEDNLLQGGVLAALNDIAYKHGFCHYTANYYIRKYIIMIIKFLFSEACSTVFVMCAYATIFVNVLLIILPPVINIPTYFDLIKYVYRTKKSLTFKQMWYHLLLRHCYYYMSETHSETLLAKYIKTFKSDNARMDRLSTIMKLLPDVVNASPTGHEYEAKCRKKIKKAIKQTIPDIFDFGTKLAPEGSSLYKHFGDLRYNVKTNYPRRKTVMAIDVIQHLTDREYATLLMLNKEIYHYDPTPIQKWTATAKLVKDKLKYTQQVAAGDTFVDELFHLDRVDSNVLLDDGLVNVAVCSQHANIGDHHLITHTYATAVLPHGFYPPKPRQYKQLLGLKGPSETLVVYAERDAINGNVIYRTHRMKTDHYEFMCQTSNYDRASTTNNSLKQSSDNFDIKTFAIDSEFAGYIKHYGQTADSIDLRSKLNTKCKRVVVPGTVPKTEIGMEQPAPLKKVIDVDKPTHLNPGNVDRPKNVQASRAGPVNGSEPVKAPETQVHAFVARYLSKKGVELDPKLLEVADSFVKEISKYVGTLTPSDKHMKPKHTDVKDKTSHKGPSADRKKNTTKVFVKRETYAGGVKYARMISNQDENLVTELTPFSSVLHENLSKSVPWYLPGKTKYEASLYANTVGGDFTSFESSQTILFRYIEMRCADLFGEQHSEEFIKIFAQELNSQFVFDVRDPECVKIHMKNPKDKSFLACLALRLSGSALTTVGNTLVAAFLQFAYYVMEKGLTTNEAFHSIRYCYGDDSLIKNGEMQNFSKFCEKHGFIVTVEDYKGPAQISLVGKVMVDGKFTIDAVRTLKKFLIAYGKYDYITNILNKWAGNYNPKLGQEKLGNIFSVIGFESFLRLKDGYKEETWKNVDQLDMDSNDTFEKAFGGEHQKLTGTLIKRLEQKPHTNDEFIELVSELLAPYISRILPVTKPGNVTTEDGTVLENGKFVLSMDDQYIKVKNYNKIAEHINDKYGQDVCKFVQWRTYEKNLLEVLKLGKINFKPRTGMTKEPRPASKQDSKIKNNNNNNNKQQPRKNGQVRRNNNNNNNNRKFSKPKYQKSAQKESTKKTKPSKKYVKRN